jgi:NADH-quinone oxidoreductase subunit J
MSITLDSLIFLVAAVIAIFGATMMISQRNPVASVLYLILSLLGQAICYIQLSALFLGVLLIIIYTGAIMVLFLFVIMLLNLRGKEDLGPGSGRLQTAVKFIVSGLIAVEIGLIVTKIGLPNATAGVTGPAETYGEIPNVAMKLFTTYVYPFQLTGILLLVAVVGAVVLAKRDEDSRRSGPVLAQHRAKLIAAKTKFDAAEEAKEKAKS